MSGFRTLMASGAHGPGIRWMPPACQLVVLRCVLPPDRASMRVASPSAGERSRPYIQEGVSMMVRRAFGAAITLILVAWGGAALLAVPAIPVETPLVTATCEPGPNCDPSQCEPVTAECAAVCDAAITASPALALACDPASPDCDPAACLPQCSPEAAAAGVAACSPGGAAKP